MSKGEKFQLCTCNAFPEHQSCRTCVVAPWEPTIRKHLQILTQKHYEKYPQATKKYVTAMENAILEEVYEVIWKVCLIDGAEEGNPISTGFITKSISNAHAKVAERRQELIVRYLMTPVEHVIRLHFQPLVKDPSPTCVTPSYDTCGQCIRNYRNRAFDYDSSDDDEYAGGDYDCNPAMAVAAKWRKRCQNWGKYPPPELRDFLIEMCLAEVPTEDEQPAVADFTNVYARSMYFIHKWYQGNVLL